MTIDKNQMTSARQWAETIGVKHPHIDPNKKAAAEVIQSLPDVIVDGDKLREISSALLSEAVEVERTDPARASTLTYAANSIDTLLPSPAPQVEIKLGAWAMHPEYGKVLIAAAHPDSEGDVRVVCEVSDRHDGSDWVWAAATDLSPLPDDQFSDLPEAAQETLKASVEDYKAGRFVDVDLDQGSNYQGSLDSSPEPQPGEAWETDRNGQHMIRTENGWRGEHGVYTDEYCQVTPLRRLVPAQEPRVLTTLEDYENAVVGTIAQRNNGITREKVGADEWGAAGAIKLHSNKEMAPRPRTVLWEPKA